MKRPTPLRAIAVSTLLFAALGAATPPPAAAIFAPLPGVAGPRLVGAVAVSTPERGRSLSFTVGDPRSERDDREYHHRGSIQAGPLGPVMTEEGVLFRIRATEAQRVSLVGSFNDWNPEATPLRRSRNGVWRTRVKLDSGRWAYFFVVDGEWRRDPDNPVHLPAEDAEGNDLGEASLLRIRHGEIKLPRSHRYDEGDVSFDMTYDRVDQIAFDVALQYSNRLELHPEMRVGGGYSFGRERWLYDVDVAQPLFGDRVLDLGATAYRRTDTPDRHRVGDEENSLAAFFFRQDRRDYHEAEGVAARVQAWLGFGQDVRVVWKSEEHRSVSKTTDWGLFGGKTRMRANRPVDEGELRSIEGTWTLDTRNSEEHPTRGLFARGSWEWAGADLGGDFEFRRGRGELRRYQKLSPGHHLDVRVTGGKIDNARRELPGGEVTGYAAVPLQERFQLGGVGTMRATQLKSIEGDRMVLANVEMRVDLGREHELAVFADVGDAWVDADEEMDLHTDAGVGFGDQDGSFRVNVAKKLDRDDDGVMVSARIHRMF
jgi:hypothetical protein